jgi:alpha-beta hydrolase superfamily lysophospholipase
VPWRRRLNGAILAALALTQTAACAPDFERGPLAAPMVKTAAPRVPRLEADAIVTADGARLALRRWLPRQGKPLRAVILAVHGFNDYSRAFEMPAASWARDGIATYAYDQRGFGANADPGRWAGGRSLCLDIDTALALVQRRWPRVPVYLLGESMGGAEVLALMGGTCGVAAPHPAGVILVAPAVWGRRTMPVANRIALWTASRLFPSARFTGSGFHILASDNIPMLIQLGRDPLFIKATRSDTIYGLVDMMDAAYAAAPVTQAPVLLLYGAHDQLIPVKPMRAVARRLTATAPRGVRVAYYRHGWHMLLRDREHERVAADVAQWIADPAAPLPSGADRLGDDFLAGRLPVSRLPPLYRPVARHER